jgi:hypothetical protein
MANTLSRQEVKRFALIGAQSRLAELRGEIASLIRAFPELARSNGSARAASSSAEPAVAPAKKAGRRRKFNMSPEQKQAVSERMKKYWAGRRKEKAGKTKAAKAAKA